MNVIGSRPDGWWRNREQAMRSLLGSLRALAASTGDAVTVVYDGRPRDLGDPGAVVVRFAPVADDEIARLVESDGDPASLRVVTSDAALATRIEAAGGRVEGAGGFRRRLDEIGSS